MTETTPKKSFSATLNFLRNLFRQNKLSFLNIEEQLKLIHYTLDDVVYGCETSHEQKDGLETPIGNLDSQTSKETNENQNNPSSVLRSFVTKQKDLDNEQPTVPSKLVNNEIPNIRKILVQQGYNLDKFIKNDDDNFNVRQVIKEYKENIESSVLDNEQLSVPLSNNFLNNIEEIR
jgi:uncharacterized protein YeeX (DUF496 family)